VRQRSIAILATKLIPSSLSTMLIIGPGQSHCPTLQRNASYWLLVIGRLLVWWSGFVNLVLQTAHADHHHIATHYYYYSLTHTPTHAHTHTHTHSHVLRWFWQSHSEHLLHLLRRLPHFNCFCSLTDFHTHTHMHKLTLKLNSNGSRTHSPVKLGSYRKLL